MPVIKWLSVISKEIILGENRCSRRQDSCKQWYIQSRGRSVAERLCCWNGQPSPWQSACHIPFPGCPGTATLYLCLSIILACLNFNFHTLVLSIYFMHPCSLKILFWPSGETGFPCCVSPSTKKEFVLLVLQRVANYVDEPDQAILCLISKYIGLRQGNIWEAINTAFQEQGFCPTEADAYRLQKAIKLTARLAKQVRNANLH